MLSVADALASILSRAQPLPSEERPVAAALGAVLAEDVTSDIDSPPWDKALMDGYALLASDAALPGARLRVLEEVVAGRVPTQAIVPGTCTRIMTGAPLPPGADAVAMIERVTLAGDVATIDMAMKPEQNLLRRAASMRRGEVVLSAGQRLRPIELGILAEVGRTTARVVRSPRVAILATGDELVDASQTPQAGQIRNSNGPLLAALAARCGAQTVLLGIARDNAADLQAKIRAGLAHDVLLLSGGVSAGVADLVPQALAAEGVEQVFHQVNLKPGKPLWFGAQAGGATLAFGLPGNPVSTLVCFGLFVRPALARLAGNAAEPPLRRAALSHEHAQRSDRPTFFPSWLRYDGQRDVVAPLAWRGSADLRALAQANCLAYFPGGERIFAAGEPIDVYPL